MKKFKKEKRGTENYIDEKRGDETTEERQKD